MNTRRLILPLAALGLFQARASDAAEPPVREVPDARDAHNPREPTATETVSRALSYAALAPERLQSWRSQAAWKDLLPVLSVQAGLGDNTLDLDRFDFLVQDDPVGRENATGETKGLEVTGTWNLPGLVFNAEVLDVAEQGEAQRELARVVLEVYYARRRAQLELEFKPPADAYGRALVEMEIERGAAALDTLTGGDFTRKSRRGDN